MKRFAVFAFILACPVFLFGASTQRYVITTTHPYRDAVRSLPRDDFDPSERAEMHVRRFSIVNGFAADLTDAQVTRLLESGEVVDVEPVVERHVFTDSVTPGQQTIPYGVSMVNAPAVWPVTKGRTINGIGPIHVAVIDTGVDYNSPELKRVFKGGHNFITGSEDPLDDFGHGTHVSGIIAAADDNAGVVGVAPEVDLFALKVLDQCGSGSNENVMFAIQWIMDKKREIGGNWIANLSLGSSDSSTAERDAFQAGSDSGIIFFAASGNSYDTKPVDGLAFPAGYPSVVSVGAIDVDQKIASFSQRGPQLKVVAPGVSVLSTIIAASVKVDDGRAFAATTPIIVKNDAGDLLDGACLPRPNVSGQFVFCGFGSPSEFPASVQGKIALISRGNSIKFVDKAKNAKAAGAVGVVVYDNIDGPLISSAFGNYLTPGSVPQFLPYVFISQADGLSLKATPDATVSLGFGYEGYALESGTSMASPHATGVAALVWAAAPTASANDVANAVINDAKDLGDHNVYGHGVVNALDTAKQLNPGAFGVGGTPPNTPRTGRVPGRRR